jgi:hypothetical protein
MGQQDDAGRGRDGDAAKKTEERRQFRIAPARLALLAWRAGMADCGFKSKNPGVRSQNPGVRFRVSVFRIANCEFRI